MKWLQTSTRESCATMNANRRLQERKQPEPMVFCKLGSEESGSVLNLSEDELCFESLTPVEEKDLLQLRLSVDLNRAIEATGQLAWIDSAKRRGGLHFLELSAPAREQIRAWLSETSTASSGRTDAPTDEPLIWQEMSVPSTQLVPIERYLEQTRWQFLRGLLMGFGICAVVMIPIFRYAGGTQVSVAQPESASTLISEPTATRPPPQPAKAEPLGATPASVVPASAASKVHSSSGPVQHPKKVSTTPQQLWSAVQAGNIKAAVALADLYTRGEGVPLNCEQARILLLVASKKNDAEAPKRLRELDKGGCPPTASEPKP